MGAITGVCCKEHEHKQLGNRLEVRKKHDRANKHSSGETEMTKDGSCPTKFAKKKSKEQILHEREIIKTFERMYPLPAGKASIKWNSFDVTHRIGGGGFGEVYLAELKDNK